MSHLWKELSLILWSRDKLPMPGGNLWKLWLVVMAVRQLQRCPGVR